MIDRVFDLSYCRSFQSILMKICIAVCSTKSFVEIQGGFPYFVATVYPCHSDVSPWPLSLRPKSKSIIR